MAFMEMLTNYIHGNRPLKFVGVSVDVGLISGTDSRCVLQSLKWGIFFCMR